MQIRLASADFSAPLRGSGPRTVTQPVVFPRPVLSATAGLVGYSLGYAGDDHHVGQLDVRLDTTITDNVVIVTAYLGVRDWSGTWDDNYRGVVDFSVVADLEDVGDIPPRPDLMITGAELNQAVQFFRSASYLDGANIYPDNSIRQFAHKNTGVRIYVDYDASAGLPPITALTGELTVQTPATTLTLTPINPGGTITPRRDAQIDMGLADDTLNFMIPGAWCNGVASLTCQVWDTASPTERSATFQRTLRFTPVAAFDLYAVGINYTASDPDIPAPTQADFVGSSLQPLVKRYPTGDVVLTGWAVIDFDEAVPDTWPSSGCGDMFGDLLDRMGDMRGGSSDIYVAVLPVGLSGISAVGGCGRSGLAAVFVDYTGDLPHEVGHALGRKHAPCGGNRCNPAPANTDPNYPQYGTFPSDSIGVFGFDPTTNDVFDPATTFDFMAYSSPTWVSAYTYMGLSGAFPPTGPGGGASVGAHHDQGREREVMFLGLDIDRDGTVTRRPSFHHPGRIIETTGCGERTLEILDRDGRVVVCTPLDCGCDEDCECWPKRIRQLIPWPKEAGRIIVWDGKEEIYTEEVPDPPRIEAGEQVEERKGVKIDWEAEGSEGEEKGGDVWYIVHWWDEAREVWRGVAPRQTEPSIVVPRSLFTRQTLAIRILATSGLATGYAELELKLEHPPKPKIDVLIAGRTPGRPTRDRVVHAVAVDRSGRQAANELISWHDARGAEIGRGAFLDTRTLSHEHQLARAVVRHEDGLAAKGWLGEPSVAGFVIHHEIVDPDPTQVEEHHHPHPPPEPSEQDDRHEDRAHPAEEED